MAVIRLGVLDGNAPAFSLLRFFLLVVGCPAF